MSYDPSHRRPPRQERWPSATPAEGWPSYRDGGEYWGGEQVTGRYEADRRGTYQRVAAGSRDYGYQADGYLGGHRSQADGYGYAGTVDGYRGAADGYRGAVDGYRGTVDGYRGAADGYRGAADGYPDAADGYAGVTDGFDGAADGYGWAAEGYGQAAEGYPSDADWYASDAGGYASQPDEYGWDPNGYRNAAHGYAAGPDDYPPQVGYLGSGSYTEYREPGSGDPRLMAPDAGIHPDAWQAEQDSRREAGQRGMMVGAVTEVLGTAVVIGVSTLAAGLFKAQTSPVAAMGGAFIDRTPAALRNALLHHFGPHGRAVLLLGMYAAIAFVAVVIGVLARRAAALGVAGIAAFAVLAAFIVVTRPADHVGDVTPVVVGGIAGVAALLWLVRASAPSRSPQRIAPLRHAHGGARRRA
jgi:hypothetical protein